jgi:hypothetical protein
MKIKAITDNGGRTFDRYTVYMWDNTYVTLSPNCDSVQGVSNWGEHSIADNYDFYIADQYNIAVNNNECLINLHDLPQNVQAHVIRLLRNSQ